MLRALPLLLAWALISAGVARAGQQRPSSIIAIKAGRLILPDRAEVLKDQIILVEDGLIKAVGPGLTPPPGAAIVDLSSSFVAPGLMDAHVHLTMNSPYRRPALTELYLTESDSYRAIRGAQEQFCVSRAGFTTVKEIGNDGDYISAGLVRAVREGLIAGPEIVYVGKIIAPYGGQSAGVTPRYEGFWSREFIDADSPEEVRKAVRKNIYFGARAIKLVADKESPFPGLSKHPKDPFFTLEEIRAAVSEAGRVGAKVTVHAMGGEAARNAVLGGAAAIEHGFDLDDELLKLMVKNNVYLVGTDQSYANWYSYGLDEATSRRQAAWVADRLRRADALNVRMAYGTDIVVDLEGKDRVASGLEVLESWKSAGVPPMRTLAAMTVNAATLLGIERERGSIRPGLKADIVAFSASPLDDITNVKSVHFVMKEGSIVRND
jgi:imidazolonepropionase-like amidohydrolase